jgi:hypothetical protein
VLVSVIDDVRVIYELINGRNVAWIDVIVFLGIKGLLFAVILDAGTMVF